MTFDKIQKTLAHAGLGSRRQIETWIQEGRIEINGKTAKLGDRMNESDAVKLDGRDISFNKRNQHLMRVILYHKPEGEICSRKDPENRPSIFENLPYIRNGRWISVGRLDFNTSGLLILTNDGGLAHQLMHPSSELEREYAVRIRGGLNPTILKRLKDGVFLEDGEARFNSIEPAGSGSTNQWLYVTVSEGRNRLVRRLLESQDLQVTRLMRIRYGNIQLPKGLRRGHCLELNAEEIEFLLSSLNTKSK